MPRGRKNMGKTATIKDRTVNVYLPDLETMELWKEMAGDISLSKFVLKAVNESISGRKRHASPENIRDLEARIAELEKECDKLNDREGELLAKIDALYQELQLCRSQASIANREFNPSEINRALIEALKGGMKTEEELIEIMGAAGSHKTLQSLIKQLEILMDFGFVEFDGKYWRWVF